MDNLEIIRRFQQQYPEVQPEILQKYLDSLVEIEFLRYHDDIDYFKQNYQDILFKKRTCITELDLAIEQAIFIVLQPLRTDLDPKDLEKTLLSWSGFILRGDTSKGEYPIDIIHYFGESLPDLEFDELLAMGPEKFQEMIYFDKMIDCDEKPQCTKVLCKMIRRLLAKSDKMTDGDFMQLLGVINYRFIRIHPFSDGNGRVSRMLLNYIFLRRNGCVPFALNNDEIQEMIHIYQEISHLLYSITQGTYLSDLTFDQNGRFTEPELLLMGKLSTFLSQKQQEANRKLVTFQCAIVR